MTAIILSVLIVIIALLLVCFDCTLTTTCAIGGIIASSFWLYHVWLLGLKDRTYEFLAAFAWLVFSIAMLTY